MRSVYSRLSLVLLSSLLLSATVGLRSDAAPETAGDESAETITRLVLRDYEVVVSSGRDGVRYNVYSQAGNILDADLTSVQLQASYPDVYDSLRPAVAREGSTGPMMLLMEQPIMEQPNLID